jgi:thiol-disulfide isomerase/thioredoxin
MASTRFRSVAALALAFLVGTPGISTAARLGDPASELTIATWAKHGPVKLADGKGKTIFVVEFWATWCEPCKESIPHLTKLQRKFKDKGVVFVGVSPEEASTVKSFVKAMGAKMDYAVAVDDRGWTTSAYLEAFGIEGIPHAFLIDKEGKIAWHGHPMAELEDVIEAVLNGEWDIRQARMYETAFNLVVKYYMLATEPLGPEEKKALAALGERVFTLASRLESGPFLNNFAWLILKDEGIEERDLVLALKCAEAAYDLSEGKVAAAADTYAWALFENGRVTEAIEMEKSALELCEDDDERAEVRETLALFEQKAESSG